MNASTTATQQQIMQMFMQNVEIKDPLNPRDALYSGRTNATRLYCSEGEHAVSRCMLSVCAETQIISHPEIITHTEM